MEWRVMFFFFISFLYKKKIRFTTLFDFFSVKYEGGRYSMRIVLFLCHVHLKRHTNVIA